VESLIIETTMLEGFQEREAGEAGSATGIQYAKTWAEALGGFEEGFKPLGIPEKRAE
jgi:hypothetical protein